MLTSKGGMASSVMVFLESVYTQMLLLINHFNQLTQLRGTSTMLLTDYKEVVGPFV